MILRCEPSHTGGWSCRAGWNLRVRASGPSPEAAFRRLCLALALDPSDFHATRRGDAFQFEACPAGQAAHEREAVPWEALKADTTDRPPHLCRDVLRRIIRPVLRRLRAA